MKPFVMNSHLETLRGVFYPTGHAVIMLPDEEEAKKACHAITDAGIASDEISMLEPQMIMDELTRTGDGADMPLPSPGTEAETMRHLADFASRGQWGLLVHVPRAKDVDKLVAGLKGLPVSYAALYRRLVIEDLVGDLTH